MQVPCGSVWEDIGASVTERGHEVAIEAWAVELEHGTCEAADMPHPIEVSLGAPLGARRLVDPLRPEVDLTWRIPPGSAQVQVRFRADEGAIDASVPDHTNFVIGRDWKVLGMSLADLRDGVDAFAPVLVDLSTPIVGEFRLGDPGDPDPDSTLDGSLEIPPPPTIDPHQVLWLRFHEGAITMSSSGPSLDPSRVSFDWEIIEH